MTTSAAAASSRALGEAWERELERYHQVLTASGKAWLTKVPTPVAVMGPTRTDARGRTAFPACYSARASVDFVGLLAGGNAVAVEAKATRAPRWHFAQQLGAPTLGKPAGVEWSALERVHHMGGLAVVVLDWGTHGTWVCTWMALEEVHGLGKSSAAPTERCRRSGHACTARCGWMLSPRCYWRASDARTSQPASQAAAGGASQLHRAPAE